MFQQLALQKVVPPIWIKLYDDLLKNKRFFSPVTLSMHKASNIIRKGIDAGRQAGDSVDEP